MLIIIIKLFTSIWQKSLYSYKQAESHVHVERQLYEFVWVIPRQLI